MQGVQVLAEEKQRRAGQGAQQVQAFNRQASFKIKISRKDLIAKVWCLYRPSKKDIIPLSYFKSCELYDMDPCICQKYLDPY